MNSAAPPTPDGSPPPGSGHLARLKALPRRFLGVQVLRFGVIGVINTAFGYGLFIALQLTLGRITHYLVVLAVSNVFAILQAYILQRWLVFRFTGGWWRGLLRFGTVYFGAFLFNLAALPLLVEALHIAVIPAQGVTTVVQVIGTYTAHRLFTFRQSRSDATAEGSSSGDVITDTAPASSSSPGDA